MGAALPNVDAFDDLGHFDEDINIRTSESLPGESVSLDEHGSNHKKLIDDAHEELYPGCKNYSKLSFTLHLLHLKYMFGWSKHSFDMLLELMLNAFPHITTFPSSFYDAKKVMKELGLGYKKIDACPNDCMLYWNFDTNEPLDVEQCSECLLSRWKKEKGEHGAHETIDDEEEVGQRIKKPKKKAAKVLRYFPLIPRLKRLYSSQKTVEHMIWHDRSRIKDGKLRHPADGKAWKAFDERHQDFAFEPRNVRLALASDGFNPFRTLSTSHSTWPVVLLPYNLPPWLCMKRSSVIMSMIIPGEKAPGDDIDVYLQPLIAELKELWNGVDAYDACTGQTFTLRAALMWTLNDFPAYANLSGWSTKGKYACPICAEHTDSTWLKHGRKFCYMGHRRLLPQNHFFRFQADQFNGEVETRCAPVRSSGSKVLEEMEQTTSWQYGKTSKDSVHRESQRDIDHDDSNGRQLWKKRSIFFDLPYWEHQLLRHNLDAMHIERNVGESMTSIFLYFDKRSKDNENARKDLVELNIKQDLHPVQLANGKIVYPPAMYTMTRAEKLMFLNVLKDMKVPDGYSSNISRCVHVKELKLINMKSHDYHILMQDLLPIALRASLKSDILELVTQLSFFFKRICAKEIDMEELDKLESMVVILLCKMEKVFPPGFFTIMIHLIVHLPEEIKLGGPTCYRWMYPIERALGDFKSDVRNRANPEACIAEGTIAKECLTYCSRYFASGETMFNKPKRNDDYNANT